MIKPRTAEQSAAGNPPLDRDVDERCRYLLGLIPDLLYRVSRDGRIVWVNSGAASAFACPPEDLVGKGFEEVFPPQQIGFSFAAIIADLGSKEGLVLEHPLLLPSGKKWVETRLAIHPGETEAAWEMVGATRQFDERQQADRAVGEREQRLQMTLKAAGIVAWELDAHGDLHEAGPVDAVFGRPAGFHHSGAHEFVQSIHPDDRARVQRQVQEAWQGEGEYDVQFRVLQSDGGVRHLEAHGMAIRDGSGRAERLLGIARDVTERKRAEDSLLKSERVLGSLFAANPGGVALVIDRVFQKVNAALCRISGYAEEELIGASTRILYPDDAEFERVGRELYDKIAKEGVGVLGARLQRKDGTTIEVLLCASPFDPQNLAAGITATIQDISELRQTEEQFRRLATEQRIILNTIAAGISRVKDRKQVWTNAPFATMFGYELSELRGMSTSALYCSMEDCQRVGTEGYATLAAGRVYATEALMKRKDGTPIWCSITGQALNPQDLGEGSIWVLQDITERKHTEASLQRERVFAKAVLDSVPGLLYLYDDQGRLVRWNRQHEAMTGYTHEELQGMHLLDWYRGEPEEAARIAAAVQRIPREGHAEAEAKLVTKSGQRIPFYFTAVALQIEGRESFVGIGIDLTERYRMEAAVRESQERLALVVEAAELGTWDWNIRSGAVAFNKRWAGMLGYQPEEIEPSYQGWENLVHGEDLPRVKRVLSAHLRGHIQFYEVEHRLRHKSGSWVWVFAKGRVIQRTPSGRPLRAAGTHLDISERKRGEEALRTSLQEKDVLLKEIHHRVKNNLQVITSLLNLQRARETQESVRVALRDMQSRIGAMAMLHEALYRSPNLAKIDFGQYVQNLCAQLARTYQRGNERARFDIRVGELALDIERAVPCGLIISELVTNAFKHAFPESHSQEIGIASSSPAPGEIELRITDNGIGLPASLVPEKARSLGLQLVCRLARQLGGELKVGPGPGAVFVVRFPLGRATGH